MWENPHYLIRIWFDSYTPIHFRFQNSFNPNKRWTMNLLHRGAFVTEVFWFGERSPLLFQFNLDFRIRQEEILLFFERSSLLHVLIRNFLFSESPPILSICKKQFPPTLFFGTPVIFRTLELSVQLKIEKINKMKYKIDNQVLRISNSESSIFFHQFYIFIVFGTVGFFNWGQNRPKNFRTNNCCFKKKSWNRMVSSF